MRKTKEIIKTVVSSALFQAQRQEEIMNLGKLHGEQQRALQEQQSIEYNALVAGLDTARNFDLTESVASYVAANKPVPSALMHELSVRTSTPPGQVSDGYIVAAPAQVPVPPVPKNARGY